MIKNNLPVFKNQYGQTLLEVLIALSAATVVVSSIVIVVISSLNNAQFSKNQNQATQFAQEGIEVIKNLAQSNWSNFSTYANTNWCLAQNSTAMILKGAGCQPNVGIFIREVDIGSLSPSSCPSVTGGVTSGALVTVTVSWADPKCPSNQYCHQVKLISCVVNTTVIQIP